MKKTIAIASLCALILCGCGKSSISETETVVTTNAEVTEEKASGTTAVTSSTESGEEGELNVPFIFIDEYEDARNEYEKFNSPASENGLGGTYIYITGVLKSITLLDPSYVFKETYHDTREEAEKYMDDQSGSAIYYATIATEAGDWIVMMDSAVYLDPKAYSDFLGKKVFVNGSYSGFSDKWKVPVITGMCFYDLETEKEMRTIIGNAYDNKEDIIGILLKNLQTSEYHTHTWVKNSNEQFCATCDFRVGGTESTSQETEPPTESATSVAETQGQKNAVKKAKSYLNTMAFSYDGLKGQLKYDGFTDEECVYGADNCGADWKEQALKKAKNYIDIMPMSYKGLVDQLEYDGFTSEEAKYGADNCGADWKEQAVKKGKSYLDIMGFSKKELINQLEYDGFTSEEAQYGAEKNGF